ncbi:TadE family type IV pilus minor pilin [Micrococcaceae bacterium Sec5.1]
MTLPVPLLIKPVPLPIEAAPLPIKMSTRQNERGAVTAEFAVALPAVIFLFAFLLAAGAAGITQLRLEEAARAGARGLARGESTGEVQGIVRRMAGEGATAGVASDGDWVTVTASAAVAGSLGSLIPWTLRASASARGETPGASGRSDVSDMPGALVGGVTQVASPWNMPPGDTALRVAANPWIPL